MQALFLQVGGIAAVLTIASLLGAWLHSNWKTDNVRFCVKGLLGLFGFGWFIAGCAWVFGIWSEVKDDIDEYCDKTTYLFSFVFLIMASVTVFILSLIRCPKFACAFLYHCSKD